MRFRSGSLLERNFIAMARCMFVRNGAWYCDIEDDGILTSLESRRTLKRFVRMGLLKPFDGFPEHIVFSEAGRRWAHLYLIPTIDKNSRHTYYFLVDLPSMGVTGETTWRRLMTFLGIPQLGRGLWATERDVLEPFLDGLGLFDVRGLTIIKGTPIYPISNGSLLTGNPSEVNQRL